jgi:hypothetical protein
MLALGRGHDGRGQGVTLTAMPSPSTAIERPETLPARTQLPDPLPHSSSWPEGPP